jgi:CheY-like chemotaxis protein
VVTIIVSDTGVGMDAATKARIFEPFFTTKEPGQGTGLGLSMVFGFVKQSGGEIIVGSEPGRGTTFTLYFPSTTGSVAATPEARAPAATTTGSETVLLVEDEAQVRKLVTNVLRRSGYHVLAAARPTDALRQSRECDGSIDLLVTDMVMPEMSGKDLADLLTAERPALRVLYMSGYTEDDIAAHPGVGHFVPKPFSLDDLLATVRAILEEPRRGGR